MRTLLLISCVSAVGRADPLPVMRREMKLLLIELSQLRLEIERLRAREEKAQTANEFLHRVIESRDHCNEKRNISARCWRKYALVTILRALS
jgi:hypothetical protein